MINKLKAVDTIEWYVKTALENLREAESELLEEFATEKNDDVVDAASELLRLLKNRTELLGCVRELRNEIVKEGQ